MIVEVKGGGVQKFEGVWYSTDRRGDSHRLGSSPMEQARSAMFALKSILREDGLGWFAAEAVVVTPDIDAPPSSTEWKASHWLARDSMSVQHLTAALDEVASLAHAAPSRERIAGSSDLRTRLFGEFSRMPMLDAQRGAVLDEQNHATEGQARVLSGLAKNPRLVVLGGAGTGKSLVLAEAAKQESSAGRSVLVTFRSPGLRSFFEPIFANRPIEVIPFDALTSERQFDVVLVDEAQDLMSAEAMDTLDLVCRGGRTQGRWRMFLDPNNQTHVDGSFDSDVFDLVGQDALEYDLSLNVRNTRAIVHMVQEYLGADVGDPGIVHGDRIHWTWAPDTSTLALALSTATLLTRNGIERSDIWVIPVTAPPEMDEFHDGIRVLSPRNAKGLEAEHVIVCDLPCEFDEPGLSNFYVALTRARVGLHIVASEPDKKRLREIGHVKGRLR
ncbi:hypothetical protein JOF48_000558 [Arthrobacter stackebrandtii]|uniref:Uncharacterized protein n=2 Tax=Arthrobacter stackebrandtii TaxID=272161 RepID=A0ABS4YSJ5_9MICC|nr:hypothetical protein [Arthrobacter stackebrandtii]